MSRYQPTPAQQEAIDLLRLAGYAVVRQRTYDGLLERSRLAESRQDWERERADGSREWAMQAFAEQRRLGDRLTHVYGVARAHGADVEELRQP